MSPHSDLFGMHKNSDKLENEIKLKGTSLVYEKRELKNSFEDIKNFFYHSLVSLEVESSGQPMYLYRFGLKLKDESEKIKVCHTLVEGLARKLGNRTNPYSYSQSRLDILKQDALVFLMKDKEKTLDIRWISEEKGKAILTVPSLGIRVYLTLELSKFFCLVYATGYEIK